MIFMSQSGLTKPQRQTDWDQWHLGHLQLMLTVDGIDSDMAVVGETGSRGQVLR
jgi:hypothetical protein